MPADSSVQGLSAISGLGQGAQGVFGMGEKARRRKQNRKKMREESRLTQEESRRLAGRQKTNRVQRGEADLGLEGGLGAERMNDLQVSQNVQQDELGRHVRDVNQEYSNAQRAGNIDVASDVLSIITAAAGGMSGLGAGGTSTPDPAMMQPRNGAEDMFQMGFSPRRRSQLWQQSMRQGQ